MLRTKRKLPPEELVKPVITASLENLLTDPATQPPPAKRGRPQEDDFDAISPKNHAAKLKPALDVLQELAEKHGKTVSQLCGRIIMLENYPKNHNLAAVGKKIFLGELEAGSSSYDLNEAEFVKNQELELTANRFQRLRLRFLPKVHLPTVKKMRTHENVITCPTIDFHDGKYR